MADFEVTFTTEERRFLVDLLNSKVKNMSIEEHRTRTPNYREFVLDQEAIAVGLLNKLRQEPG